MAIKIGSNINSQLAQRRLGEATSSLSKIYERLSSGQRINTASDDAAGLAISEDLNSKVKVFNQAIRNGNDGISVFSIADSAVSALSGIVTRIQELAEQSANGSYTNTQRSSLDAEAQALSKEYLRIAQTTTFNGINVFNGALGSGLGLQLGYGTEGALITSVGGKLGTGTFASRTTSSSYVSSFIETGDINGDGFIDLVSSDSSTTINIQLGNGDGTFRSGGTLSGNASIVGATLTDINNDGVLDIATADGGGTALIVYLGTGTGAFGARTTLLSTGTSLGSITSGDLNGDGFADLITTDGSSPSTFSVFLNNGNGTFSTRVSYVTGSSPVKVATGDFNGDGKLDVVTADSGGGGVSVFLGTGTGTFGTRVSYTGSGNPIGVVTGDFNGDGNLDIASGNNNSTISLFLGNGNGTFASAVSTANVSSSTSISKGDFNGDGFLDLVVTNDSMANSASVFLSRGNGTFASAVTYAAGGYATRSAVADLNGDGVLDILTDNNNASTNIFLGNSKDGIGALLSFSLKSKVDALQAIAPLQRAQNNLLTQRGVIGANQSRLTTAVSTLTSMSDNFRAANSRIRDADFAADSATLISKQILQQAATAVLAQANQDPKIALDLLK